MGNKHDRGDGGTGTQREEMGVRQGESELAERQCPRGIAKARKLHLCVYVEISNIIGARKSVSKATRTYKSGESKRGKARCPRVWVMYAGLDDAVATVDADLGARHES